MYAARSGRVVSAPACGMRRPTFESHLRQLCLYLMFCVLCCRKFVLLYLHTHPFNGPLSGTMPAPHRLVFTGRMPFLPPTQQRQSIIIKNNGTSVLFICFIIGSNCSSAYPRFQPSFVRANLCNLRQGKVTKEWKLQHICLKPLHIHKS